VNPGERVGTDRDCPLLSRVQEQYIGGRVLFRDAGFVPELSGTKIKLGPGQMSAVGFGNANADPKYDLGIQKDVAYTFEYRPTACEVFEQLATTRSRPPIAPPAAGDIRIILQQRGKDGHAAAQLAGRPS